MTFKNKEEFIEQARKDGFCREGIEWAKEQKNLPEILKNIPDEWRVWCILQYYVQFSKQSDWEAILFASRMAYTI